MLKRSWDEKTFWNEAFCTTKWVPLCEHDSHKITFPDETEVYASSIQFRESDDLKNPDFGLYLENAWEPASRAEFVTWLDFGLPLAWETAGFAIINAFKHAKEKKVVEVGCLGGHGRTGTVLACMGVLSGLSPSEAVSFVRKNYCSKAVETVIQEWWVDWFRVFVYGGETLPVRDPDRTTYKYQTSLDWENYNDLA